MAQSRIQEDEEESKHLTSHMDDGENQGGQQSEDITSDSDEEEDDEDILIKPKDLIFRSNMNERKWLRTRGKGHMIDFQDDELKKLQ